MIELESWATTLFKSLPSNPDEAPAIFNAKTVPRPPGELSSRLLVMEKRLTMYGTWYIDHLRVSAEKQTYGSLGLLILAVLFRKASGEITLHLSHPASEVRYLVIDSSGLTQEGSGTGLRIRAEELEYYPTKIKRYPWDDEKLQVTDLPFFSLTNRDDCIATEEEYKSRDTVIGFGSIGGTVRLAQLLLDMSRPNNEINEIVLESEPGFRGVAPASCEVTFWLPGSTSWQTSWFEQ